MTLLRAGNVDLAQWVLHGPQFFMAGLTVLVAGSPGYDRRVYLALGLMHEDPREDSLPVALPSMDRAVLDVRTPGI